ncbi:MAG: hypothetical protein NTX28_00115 [Novosphingobium sp.]|nr:hypothetical protein [Novosphingobium sp.]
MAEFVTEYQRAYNEIRNEARASRNKTERDLVTVKKQIEDIVDAVCNGLFHPSMKERPTALEERKAALTQSLAEQGEEEPVALHPGLADIYRLKVADLRTALNAEETRTEATTALCSLLTEIRMIPSGEGHEIELVGELGAILALGDAQYAKPRLFTGAVSTLMVAGAGYQKYLPLFDVDCGFAA